jgi:hypothetical protein
MVFSRKRGRLGRGGERLEGAPHARGEGDAAVERAHLGLHGVEGRAQLGRALHGLEVGDHGHRQLQALGDPFERVQGVGEGAGLAAVRRSHEGVQPGAGVGEQRAHAGLDVLAADAVEGQRVGEREEGVVGVRR